IVEQGARYSLAYSGAGRISGVDAVTAQYEMQGAAAVLNGDYHYVIDGHTAEHLVVAARNAAGDLGLFVIDAGAEGVSRKLTPGMDQTRKLAKIDLRSVNVAEADILQQGEAASQTLKNVLSLAAIALAAEQVGVADKSLALTVDYIGERKQFGRAVGSFQAMKHKAADMMSKVEAARSALYYAACIADEFFSGNPMGAELYEAASVAKAYCCDAAFFNAGCAIQMHGGVGFTWEYDVHLYFKRAKAAQLAFGDSAWHREQIATQLLGAADG
ncbi:MAG: acyl-CoA dehydrogenase, partial [Gammaproteobacteria bacterium]|nr:acyl-CoA dehydrogenase [Gammaproteobacteria bacterium]